MVSDDELGENMKGQGISAKSDAEAARHDHTYNRIS
jgi:hypothetical protein